MPSERFVEALNEQIGREFLAAHQYTAVGPTTTGLPSLASQSSSTTRPRRSAATGCEMVNYLTATGSDLSLGEVPAPKNSFADHVEPIRLALETRRR